jgi:protein-disulfide isomerase
VKKLFGLIVALALIAAVVGYYVLERGARDGRGQRATGTHADEIFRSPTSAVVGNPDGDVNVVAFFDYNCPYCRKDVPALDKLIAEDGNVRLVLKELPVLGPDSVAAARLVLAARRQGKEHALHQRLIGTPGRVNKGRALSLAAGLGLDTVRLEEDMDDPEITATILENMRLANQLGVRGMPFYLVGDRVVSGGGGDFYAALTAEVANIRQNGCLAAC